jgi:hypothetical protein
MSAPFEQLERELVAAAARLAAPAAAVAPAAPVRRRRRIPAAALAGVLLALAATGAWLAADRQAAPPEPERAAPAWPLRVGESRIASVRAPAAGAQPAWAVRVSRPKPATVCVTVGQVRARKLGLAGADGRFRELPIGTADACSAESALAARPLERGGIVLGGVAGDRLRSVRIQEGGAPVEIPHSREGAFVYVTEAARAQPVLSLRWSDGRAKRFIVPSLPLAIPTPTPLRPPKVLPAPRRVEPSPTPVEPAARNRRDGST